MLKDSFNIFQENFQQFNDYRRISELGDIEKNDQLRLPAPSKYGDAKWHWIDLKNKHKFQMSLTSQKIFCALKF